MTADANAYWLLGQVIAAGVAVGGPLVGVLIWLHKRFDKKADKHTVNNQFQEAKSELAIHRQDTRDDIRKLYTNAEADRKLVRDGFDRLSAEIHEVHVSMLNKIGDK